LTNVLINPLRAIYFASIFNLFLLLWLILT